MSKSVYRADFPLLESSDVIYMDNAATSYPKAPKVSDAMKYYIDEVGASINRSSYRNF